MSVDYTKDVVLLAVLQREEQEIVIGLGQYSLDQARHAAEVSFAVADTYQNSGVGTTLLETLTLVAQKRGLLGFTAEVLPDNAPMLHVFEKMGFDLHKQLSEGVYDLTMLFRKESGVEASDLGQLGRRRLRLLIQLPAQFSHPPDQALQAAHVLGLFLGQRGRVFAQQELEETHGPDQGWS